MSDWNLPSLSSAYSDFLDYLKARDYDSLSLGHDAITNPLEGMMRYVRASDKFQEYLSSVWTDKLLSLAGGGTGASSASGARTSLGLGTIATQAASGVAITGGSITGLSTFTTNGAITIGQGITAGTGAVGIVDSTGKIPAISSTYFASLSGANLTNLNGSNISSGTINFARLGSGGGGSTKFLREDNTYQDVSVVKSVQLVTINYTASTEGNVDTTLPTTLTNYLNAFVTGISGLGVLTWTIKLTSNTNIRMNIPVTGGVGSNLTIYCYVVEYKNVG